MKKYMLNTIYFKCYAKFLLCTLVIFLSTLFTSCDNNVPEILENVNDSSPNLDPEQLQRIHDSILDVVDQSDRSNDTDILNARLSGPELQIRTAQIIAKVAGVNDSNTEIPDSVKQNINSNTSIWPRTSFTITDVTKDRQSERLLVLNQSSVYENYKLWALVRLFAKTELPKFEVSNSGSPILNPNDSTLSIVPVNAFSQYADILQNGQSSQFDSKFVSANDELRKQIQESYNASASQLNQINGSQKQEFISSVSDIRTMGASDGSALSVGLITSKWVRTAGGEALATPASDVEKALFQGKSAAKNLEAIYLNVVAIHIPASGSDDQCVVLGAERYPVAVNPF